MRRGNRRPKERLFSCRPSDSRDAPNPLVRLSPDSSNTISVEHTVGAHNREVVCLRLSDKHAVEWVLVVQRKLSRPECVVHRNCQLPKAAREKNPLHVIQ